MNKDKQKRGLIAHVTVLAITLITCVTMSVLSFSSNVLAQSDANTVLKKVMLRGLGYCYLTNGQMNNSVSEVDFKNQGVYALIGPNGSKDGAIRVPNSVGNTLSDADISCKELFEGYSGVGGSISGLFSLFGKNVSSTSLADLGYTDTISGSGNGGGDGCFQFTYKYRESKGNSFGDQKDDGRTNKICVSIDANGNVAGDDVITEDDGKKGPIYLHYADGEITAHSDQYPNGAIFTVVTGFWTRQWSEVKGSFENAAASISNLQWEDGTGKLASPGYSIIDLTAEQTGGDSSAKNKMASNASTLALQYFSGDKSAGFSSFQLNDEDKYFLYSSYLNQALKSNSGVLYIDSNCYDTGYAAVEASKAAGDGGYAVRSGSQWCPLHGVNSVSGTFNIVKNDQSFTLDSGSFADVINGLMKINYDELEKSGTTIGTITGGQVSGLDSDNPNGGGDNPGGGDSNSGLAVCYEGTGVLGWIACPVIELVGNATSYLYENFVEPSLQVKAGEIMTSTGAVHGAWETFRNFANTLFAVAFAVIILAQLTGIGISNYNIKKMLPRLIMVAVLVNISFILCQIAVDLSNILGVALKDMFLGLAGDVQGIKSGNLAGGIAGSIVSGLLMVGTATFVAGVAVSAAALASWIVPILVALLGCVVAVIFFFILLGVRQAGIVILVVLTPMAIVCYALPNTKSIFDKWKKMFTSLLLLYPICGLMMGAGEYAGSILISVGQNTEDGIFYLLTAMLINVVPFFFIPSLLKQSMLAMGNIGAKISNFGNGIGRGLTGGIRRSRAYQEHQGEAQRQLNFERDTRDVRRLNGRADGKGLVGRGRRLASKIPGVGKLVPQGLTGNEMLRAARAQTNIDKTTDMTAQAIGARWDNDGTSNDIEALKKIYKDNTMELFKNPGNREALELQKAAESKLASGSGKSRRKLMEANDELTDAVRNIGDDTERTSARQVMQRTANNLMRMNGPDVKRSPLLSAQVKGLQDASGKAYDPNARAEMMRDSIDDFSERTMSTMSRGDLEEYLSALGTTFAPGSDEYNDIVDNAVRLLGNPRAMENVERDALPVIQKIADKKYTQKAPANADARTADAVLNRNISNLAGASDAEFGRLHERINSGKMDGADSASMINTMGQALVQTAKGQGGVKLSASRASQMAKVLTDNNPGALAELARNANMSVEQFQERLDMNTGLKVRQQPRATLASKKWHRATAADVAATGGQINGSTLNEGDWVHARTDQNGQTTMRKLSSSEAQVADLMQQRETESMLAQEDQTFATQQANMNYLQGSAARSRQLPSERRQTLENQTQPTQSGQGQIPKPVRLQATDGQRIARNPQSRFRVNNIRRRTSPPPNPPA